MYPIQNFLPIYSDHSRLPHLVQLSISRLWPKSLCKDYITLHPDKPTSPVTRYSNPSTDINWRMNWGSLDYLCTYTLIQYHHELTLITNTFSRSFLIPTTSLRMEFSNSHYVTYIYCIINFHAFCSFSKHKIVKNTAKIYCFLFLYKIYIF